ncbi:alpha/beta hydrolase family protein [Dickeya fangzhongdai]|uniref:alpha/beta hydrolase family protein n=1 Tax=Dickeya fangzhongdai TaxID=1778540 RepID=UPI0023E35581|nr:alpha/beta hydrolase [Dickeya fangzhongdai]WES87419.1 alpha/beta hydrolase [Dickeya fangzhongdai]
MDKFFRLPRWLSITCAIAFTLLSFLLYQNYYKIREEKVTIPTPTQPLNAILAMPATLPPGQKPGVVIFVHGDGPIEATHGGFYRPMWEAIAKAGYASLSWNKPGVGGAPGNWLLQNMDDRANEVMAAIRWVQANPQLDGTRIGLWGASQGGWVLPKVARLDPAVCFMIAVSPAINWLQQGQYNTIASMKDQHASAPAIEQAVSRNAIILRYLQQGKTLAQYQQDMPGKIDLTPDRWTFIQKNFQADATDDLKNIHTNVLLMLGGKDINVDVNNTRNTYQALLTRPGQLTVKYYPPSTHNMVDKSVEESLIKSWTLGLFFPRQIFTAGYLADQTRFIADTRCPQ